MADEAADEGERRAETFELFFDLMFVFAITQITHLIETMSDASDLIAAVSVLLFLWWMYAGFVWLASNTANIHRLAIVLLTAMLGFFFLATGIPAIHEGGGWLAGLAAVFVVLVHLAGFRLLAGEAPARAMLRVGAVNLSFAALLMVSGLVPPGIAWVPRVLMIAGLLGMAIFYAAEAFDLVPAHFVERHGLLLIIVFGESIISVGTGLGAHPGARAVIEAGLVIVLVTALWLTWFTHDDRRSEAVLRAASPQSRGRMALIAYWAAFAVMIGGILALAAGMKLHFLGETARPGAWIAVSLALYFAGVALFRWELGLSGAASRALGTFLALAIWPVTEGVGAAQAAEAAGHAAVPGGSAVGPLVLAIALAAAMQIADSFQFGARSKASGRA